MSEYLSFWFAKFLIDVFITVGVVVGFILLLFIIEWKNGYKKNNVKKSSSS